MSLKVPVTLRSLELVHWFGHDVFLAWLPSNHCAGDILSVSTSIFRSLTRYPWFPSICDTGGVLTNVYLLNAWLLFHQYYSPYSFARDWVWARGWTQLLDSSSLVI